ncbi:MAG: hypothetical protein IT384_17540 [Deltaproteobacteria bacterium]|nr:hypothetical protein [Deltaproteobacteria bacterium]
MSDSSDGSPGARLQRHLPILAGLVTALVLGTYFHRHHRGPPFAEDEGAVYYSTSYFRVAFLEWDPRSPEWARTDAIDHPPAWKYAYGLLLTVLGRPLPGDGSKEAWNRGMTAAQRDGTSAAYLARTLDAADLMPSRLFALACVLVGLFLFAAVAGRATTPLIASLALLLAAFQGVIRWVSGRALIDPLLLLFIAGSILLTERWLVRGPGRGRLAVPWALGLGVLLGVLGNTKITGVVGIGGVVLALVLWRWRAQRSAELAAQGHRRALASLAVVVGTAVVVGIAINPTLWSDPIGMAWKMVDYRAHALEVQMRFDDPAHFVSPQEGLRRFMVQTLLRPDPLWLAASVPIVAPMVVGGAFCFLARAETTAKNPAWAAITAHFAVWLPTTALTYRMDWPRYTLPVIPFFLLFFSLALIQAAAWVRARAKGRG